MKMDPHFHRLSLMSCIIAFFLKNENVIMIVQSPYWCKNHTKGFPLKNIKKSGVFTFFTYLFIPSHLNRR